MTSLQIAVSYSQRIPLEAFDDFVHCVAAEKLNLRIEPRDDDGIFAGLEWLLPTAAIVFIGKAYFETFLREMGRDHYQLLKAGLKSLHSKLFGPSSPRTIVVSSPGKASATPAFSVVFSIVAEAHSRLRFKLLLRLNLTASEYDETIDAFFAFLTAFHDGALESAMLEQLNSARILGDTILLTYDLDLKALKTIDPVNVPKPHP